MNEVRKMWARHLRRQGAQQTTRKEVLKALVAAGSPKKEYARLKASFKLKARISLIVTHWPLGGTHN